MKYVENPEPVFIVHYLLGYKVGPFIKYRLFPIRWKVKKFGGTSSNRWSYKEEGLASITAKMVPLDIPRSAGPGILLHAT